MISFPPQEIALNFNFCWTSISGIIFGFVLVIVNFTISITSITFIQNYQIFLIMPLFSSPSPKWPWPTFTGDKKCQYGERGWGANSTPHKLVNIIVITIITTITIIIIITWSSMLTIPHGYSLPRYSTPVAGSTRSVFDPTCYIGWHFK